MRTRTGDRSPRAQALYDGAAAGVEDSFLQKRQGNELFT
jgi:hypothetical protein